MLCIFLIQLVVARPPGGSAGETLVYSAGYNIWGQLGYRLPDNVQEVHTLRVVCTIGCVTCCDHYI
jgi:hypothetical protein